MTHQGVGQMKTRAQPGHHDTMVEQRQQQQQQQQQTPATQLQPPGTVTAEVSMLSLHTCALLLAHTHPAHPGPRMGRQRHQVPASQWLQPSASTGLAVGTPGCPLSGPAAAGSGPGVAPALHWFDFEQEAWTQAWVVVWTSGCLLSGPAAAGSGPRVAPQPCI
eukprot:1138526-Pelagomonas_calceolata.AAC.8